MVDSVVNRILMIAFHFPPFQGSSGIHRTVKFAQYLSESGWEPIILAPHPRAYGKDASDFTPACGLTVHRAFCLDSGRHLAIRGRYARSLSLPDRWVSWCLGAIPSGYLLLRRYRPQFIWSTYPIATAHLIGLALHRLTGIPWIVDMRDPMIDAVHPVHPWLRWAYEWIEQQAVRYSKTVVCTTVGAAENYRQKYFSCPPSKFTVIENGYDEDAFMNAESTARDTTLASTRVTLVHSGTLYPLERDPRCLFQALAELVTEGAVSPDSLRIILRATGHDTVIGSLIETYQIGSIVQLAPPLNADEAIREICNTDGLLLLQAANCNHQIPAKAYEYLRSRRPILALTDPTGDTATMLHQAGVTTICRLDCASDIKTALLHFLEKVNAGTAPRPSADAIEAGSRRNRTKELARLLDQLADKTPTL